MGILKKKRGNKKLLLNLSVIFILIFLSRSIYLKSGYDKESKKEEVEGKIKEINQSYIEIDAEDLARDFNKSHYRARKKYEGKNIELKGKIKSIKISLDKPYLVLEGDKLDVNCFFEDINFVDSINKLEPGEEIKLRGKVGSYRKNLNIEDCIF